MTPFVRHMLLCKSVRYDEQRHHSIDILGLLSNINAKRGVKFPIHFDLSVFLSVSSGRGTGTTLIRIVSESDDSEIYRSPIISVTFSSDPLRVIGLTFRIPELLVPQPDVYTVEFWYNGLNLVQQTLKVEG